MHTDKHNNKISKPEYHIKTPTDGPGGIIQNAKVHYRAHMISRFIADVEAKVTEPFLPSILDAIRYVARAWKEVLPSNIQNTIRKLDLKQVQKPMST